MNSTQKIKSLVYLICFIACVVVYVVTSSEVARTDDMNSGKTQTISLETEKKIDFPSKSNKL